MILDLSSGVAVTSLSVNGKNVVNARDGMITSVTIGNKIFSSLHLLRHPIVRSTGSGIQIKGIRYGDKTITVFETWTFLTNNKNIDWKITRTFSKSISLNVVQSPVINFESISTWDGAIQGYGGLAWFYLFTDKPSSYGVHSRSSSFWKGDKKDGLKITVNTPANNVAMTYKRTKVDRLSYSIMTSSSDIIPLNDTDSHRRQFLRSDGNVWSPVNEKPINATEDILFSYIDNDRAFDRGDLIGVNGKQVNAVLNTIARIGVIDSLHNGGNSWATPYGPICLHEQYIAQLGLGIGDERYLRGYEACLNYYRDHAFKNDGRVFPRWAYTNEDAAPGQFNHDGFYEAQWGILMDSNPDFVSNVSDLFNLTGDRKWVAGQQKACEKALDWILRRDINHNGLVEMMNSNQNEKKSSDWIDIVWASFENAFVNAKLYYALVQWSDIERVLGDPIKSNYYAECARKLKTSFNKNIDDGGFWDEHNHCYVHWRDNQNVVHGTNMVTPVNFMAIAYGICDDPVRQKVILDAIETKMLAENLFFWPLTMASYAPGESKESQYPFPSYENGDLFLSWGSIGVAAYAKYQPAIALKYIENVLNQYGKDGLAFQRYSRKDQSGQGDDILAGNSLSIVGLYQSIYGVNPRYNRLLLNPHLPAQLNGTKLKYHFHGRILNIDLNAANYAVSDGKYAITSAGTFGFNSTAASVTYFDGEKSDASLQVIQKKPVNILIHTWEPATRSWKMVFDHGGSLPTMYKIGQLRAKSQYLLKVNGKPQKILYSDQYGMITFSIPSVKTQEIVVTAKS
jgi:hypothetical protein